MKLFTMQFLHSDQGQDLTEYTLLMVFVVLAIAGIFGGMGDSIAGITSTSNSQLQAASAATKP